MRCSHCALPLSPTRTSCPRCGTPVNGMASGHKELASSSAGTVQKPGTISSALQRPERGNHSISFGFGLAGLCLITASLILIFVYFMAQNLPLPSNGLSSQLVGGQSGSNPTSTKKTSVTRASSASASPTVSPTATYPGQQYIDNAQMARAVNANNGQPLQLQTTFRVNQTMYISFEVHPNGHVGAICLLWFLNGSQFLSYPFALRTTATSPAYSYAAANSIGSGYVEIYWESAPSCIDPNKILGDRVNFNVTA